MTRRLALLALALAAFAFALAACGGGDDGGNGDADGGGGGGGQTLELLAGPGAELKYDKSSLEASAVEVTITMVNEGTLPHNVAIEGDGVDVVGEIVEEGGTSTATATLEPGEYTFYCSVPGHREGGMEGTLTVS